MGHIERFKNSVQLWGETKLGVKELLVKFRVYYIVILFTVVYWIFGLTARFYPDIFMPPVNIYDTSILHGSLEFIHVQLIEVAIAVNVLNIILAIMMLWFKLWNIQYTSIVLVINILTLIVGPYFVAFPIMLM